MKQKMKQLVRYGTTRSRINFFMNKFRKLGFIHCNGSLQIHRSLLNMFSTISNS
jgi:hypothetical protein